MLTLLKLNVIFRSDEMIFIVEEFFCFKRFLSHKSSHPFYTCANSNNNNNNNSNNNTDKSSLLLKAKTMKNNNYPEIGKQKYLLYYIIKVKY